jgi:hypothetical protein
MARPIKVIFRIATHLAVWLQALQGRVQVPPEDGAGRLPLGRHSASAMERVSAPKPFNPAAQPWVA